MQTILLPETGNPRIRRPHSSPQPQVPLIHISQPGAADMIVKAIHHHPVLIQLPSVFALMASPTTEGAYQLDACKMRLEGKNYGTAIGSLHRFLEQAQPGALPAQFNSTGQFSGMTGSFIRMRFREKTFHSKSIRSGTHQGLLLNGALRGLFRRIENSFCQYPPDEIWNGRNYNAPLCTSCNISGHPDGSITTLAKAIQFARGRNIPFIVTATAGAGEKGSYPVFGFAEDGVHIHREGPGLERFKERIPVGLRNW